MPTSSDHANRNIRDHAAPSGVPTKPVVREVSLDDIGRALGAGFSDFKRAPLAAMALGGIYAAGGWVLVGLLMAADLPYLVYPLAMGFALVAPFLAVGFYALSDLIQSGERITAGAIWARVRRAAQGDVRWMALITGFALIIWLDLAAIIFFSFFGLGQLDATFWSALFGTAHGWMFLALGNAVGAFIAVSVFSISAVSFPLLYDRDVDFGTAMITSVNVVKRSPGPLLAWCAFIGVTTTLAVVAGFVGLLVVLPVIGCATWHLYQRAVS